MRKYLSILLALCIAVGLTSFATAEENPYAEKYDITWTTYIAAPLNEDAVVLKKYEEMFNVDINMLNIEDANFLEVLNTYIAGGDTPDVIRLKDPSQLSTYIAQGVVGSFDVNLVREYMPYTSKLLDELEDGAFWSMGASDGEQYGIPGIAAGNAFHLPIVYNLDWMEAIGVTETPTTLEELETLMYKFANEDPDGNGEKDTYGVSADGLRNLFGAYGVNPGAADGRTDHSYFQLINGEVEYAATTEQYREALRVAKKWYDDGVIDPEFITGENTGGYWAISNSFINGRIGMTVRGNYYHWVMPGMYMDIDENGEDIEIQPGNVAKELIAVNPDARIVFGQPVEGPYGKGVKAWNMLAQFYVFSPELTEDTDRFIRALQIMDYALVRYHTEYSDAKQAWLEWAFGPEGENWYWTIKEDGSYSIRQEFADLHPDVGPSDDYGVYLQMAPTPAERNVGRGAEFAYGLNYDKDGIINLIQFSLPKMGDYQNGITQLKDTAMIEFITGKRDLDKDWDAYIAELNQAGLSEMAQEVRDWYWSNHQ
ncbi:MAG: extracellular solute-binding protein [Oscillospiraceae bacterium]|jgi:putative aldouronate transport system substrate-binding protein|nr:extracellular solute-binding protein [Oscillospiraceae bacterium]